MPVTLARASLHPHLVLNRKSASILLRHKSRHAPKSAVYTPPSQRQPAKPSDSRKPEEVSARNRPPVTPTNTSNTPPAPHSSPPAPNSSPPKDPSQATPPVTPSNVSKASSVPHLNPEPTRTPIRRPRPAPRTATPEPSSSPTKPPPPPSPPLPTSDSSTPASKPPPTKSKAPKSQFQTALRSARAQTQAYWAPLNPRLKSSLPFVLALLFGLLGGTYLTRSYLPFLSATLLEPDSPDDARAVAQLEEDIDSLFVVKVLRGKTLAAGRAIRGEGSGGWREIKIGRESRDAIGEVRRAELGFEREKKAHRAEVEKREAEIVASGGATNQDGKEGEVNLGDRGGREERIEGLRQQAEALGLELGKEAEEVDRELETRFGVADGTTLIGTVLKGSKGLAVERIFWNADEAEMVAVVWLGRGLCGWPGVVHGGLLATVMLEKIAMAGTLYSDDVLAPSTQHGSLDWRRLQEMEVQYKKPTYAGAFYVVRALPKLTREGGHLAVEVDSTLETLEGVTCVQTKGVLPTDVPTMTAGPGWWQRLNSLVKEVSAKILYT